MDNQTAWLRQWDTNFGAVSRCARMTTQMLLKNGQRRLSFWTATCYTGATAVQSWRRNPALERALCACKIFCSLLGWFLPPARFHPWLWYGIKMAREHTLCHGNRKRRRFHTLGSYDDNHWYACVRTWHRSYLPSAQETGRLGVMYGGKQGSLPCQFFWWPFAKTNTDLKGPAHWR